MFGAVMWRLAKSFFVHLPMGLLGLVLIYFICQGQDSLNDGVRAQYAGVASRSLLTLLEDARGDLMLWCATAMLVSWILSGFFLSSAERARPANEAEGGASIGLWSFMLILLLVFMAAYGWAKLDRAQEILLSGTMLLAVAAGALACLVAYYLSTGLMVKRVMRPSVPLAAALPTRWS
jgi:hydrogenase-4 membrane subunit HyfE